MDILDKVVHKVRDVDKLNTTTLNMALGLPGMSSVLSNGELLRVRVVTVVSSGLSMFVGFFSIYYMYNYDHRKKLFRHELIFFLIICDFIKALILLLYPIIVLINPSLYASPAMIHTLGWFTQFATEGSDFAIGFFAIHFALLIFKPNWKWRNRRSGNMEGGLYKYRNFIWPTTLLIPAVMASLVFIDFNTLDPIDPDSVNIVLHNDEYASHFKPRRGGYKPWSAWCYLPARPVWYKYVLSWGPRYFLILMIIFIYLSIYIYVVRETRRIKEQFYEFDEARNTRREEMEKNLPPFKKYFLNPVSKTLNLLILILTFNLDLSSDDSIESKRSYSITTLYTRNNSQQDSVAPKRHSQPMLPPANNSTTKDKEELISLRSFNFHNATNAGGKGEDVSYPPKTSSISSNSAPNRSSLGKIVSEINDNGSSLSSETTNDNDTTSDEIHLQERPQSYVRTEYNDGNEHDNTDSTKRDTVVFEDTNVEQPTVDISAVQDQFRRENYANMKRKRAQIQKNLRAIFIYPFSYILIWTFPIAADISQTHHEMVYGPIMWLTYIDTFIRPMSCFIHSFVFIFKERPWKYSWDKVEGKILLDRYMLRGEIGEDEMDNLCQSTMGRRGWYYRSTWNKRKCWKHQGSSIKLWLWYIGKFFQCIFTLKKPNYYDNCDDNLYWNRYYYLDRDAGYPRSLLGSASDSGASSNISTLNNQPLNDNKMSSHASSHHMETVSHNYTFDNSSRNNQSHYSTHHIPVETKPAVDIPWYWTLLHSLPMLHGVDLDELNRSVRLKYTNDDDDFVIPGLNLALNTNGNKKTTTNSPNTDKKANIHNKQSNNYNKSRSKKSYPRYGSSSRKTYTPGIHSNNNRSSSIALKNQKNRLSSEQEGTKGNTNGEVDLLAFLNDPSM